MKKLALVGVLLLVLFATSCGSSETADEGTSQKNSSSSSSDRVAPPDIGLEIQDWE